LTAIEDLLLTFKDYNHIKVLADLLAKKMMGPAKVIVSRLTDDKNISDEVNSVQIKLRSQLQN
jgi:predicted metal-dependent hydrolase